MPRSMSSQRRWACIAITARFSCSVNGRGEMVRPVVTMGVSARVSGLGFGTFSSSSGGMTFLADSSSSTAVLHLVVAGVAPLVGEPPPHQVQAREDPEHLEETVLARARVLPARARSVRSPGRAETAAAAAACPASARRPSAASRPRDRRRSGLPCARPRRVFWPATRPPSSTGIGSLAAASAAAASLAAASLAAASTLAAASFAAALAAAASSLSTGAAGAACVVCPPPARRPASARAVARTPGARPIRELLRAGLMGTSSTRARA